MQLKPWLCTVARKRCLGTLRARRDEVALEHVREPSAAGVTAADVECREDLHEILGDVARLPDDQRAALVLAEWATSPTTRSRPRSACARTR